VHVPFCARACPYCDFDFVVGRRVDDVGWVEALHREVEGRAAQLERVAEGPAIGTLYVGGGTPSALGPEGLARLGAWVEQLAARLGGGASFADEERTIELNPEHVDAGLVSAVIDGGFDRVSLGVQTFAHDGLRTLGRVHDAATARAAVTRVVERGLRVSADLIVGFPGQSPMGLRDDIAQLDELGVDHVSVYALTIEPDVPWQKLVRRGLRVLPDDDEGAARLEEANERLRERGYSHYEVASYGRGGERALHNTKYWTWTDYLGFGPSAASARFHDAGAVTRRTNRRGLAAWMVAPQSPAELERLDAEAAAREGLWTGLRRLEGLDPDAFMRRFARDPGWLSAVVAPLMDDGALHWRVDRAGIRRLAVAPGRWLWHDWIAARILAG